MTTTREEFEAWMTSETNVREDAVWHEDKQRYTLLSRKQADWVLWQAAHLAGQRAMQERAAIAAGSSGMTLRDYFAAHAMQGIVSNIDRENNYQRLRGHAADVGLSASEWIARDAYKQADAMLRFRDSEAES